jgi:phosphatidylinositol-3-phosphatase
MSPGPARPRASPRRLRLAVAAFGIAVLLAGVGWLAWSVVRVPDTGPPETDGPVPSPVAGLPHFRHVYVVILENHSYGDVVGDPAAPYLNSLIARGGLATQWFGIARPSQPNYLALFAGETLNVQDNLPHDFQERNLADQLEEHGLTWREFAENVPSDCFTGATAKDGPDGPGTYARKHAPAISFRQISGDPARCANITDFSHFATGAASFNLVVPNLCHDMHDCSVAAGDAFLAGFIPRVIDAPDWGPDDLLVITFDEGHTSDQHISTVIVSDAVAGGYRSAVKHDHYSLLRTLEASWGLGCLGNACTANDIGEFFVASPAGSPASPAASSSPGAAAP